MKAMLFSNVSPNSVTDLRVSRGERLVLGKRTYVMGIINVTPDSFSGMGWVQMYRLLSKGHNVSRLKALISWMWAPNLLGPGSVPVTSEEELARLIPVLEALVSKVTLPISVDTYKSEVARQAIEAGATIVNDIWGLKADPKIAALGAATGAPIILMHNQYGHQYRSLIPDMISSLFLSIATARDAGVTAENIILDPGIGFGKTADHNLEILKRLGEFRSLGYPLLVGTSRKSTIGLVLDGLPVDQRLEGTAATVAMAIAGGADIVRVHDVVQMVLVCRMTDAIVRGWRPEGWNS